MTGRIVKALSGFYYVDCDGEIIQCKPRGKFRYEKVSPLVGDRVDITPTEPGKGRLDTIHPRKNQFRLEGDAIIADTPGFAAFDTEIPELLDKERLAYGFREFVPYLGQCRFVGCAHVKEKGCAIRAAVKEGKIQKGRHDSYVRLYAVAKEFKAWEKKPSRPIK